MIKTNPTIAILDSGIGGVSVLIRLMNKYKAGNFLYFADNLNMPYGEKDKNFVKNRVESLIEEIKTKYKADIIIVACNTASSCIKPMENVFILDFDKCGTYLTTELTSKNLKKENFIPLKELATVIENDPFNDKKIKRAIKERIKFNKKGKYILGCTHFELKVDLFKKLCKNVELNSESLIDKLDLTLTSKPTVKIVLTKQDLSYENKIWKILKLNVPSVFS